MYLQPTNNRGKSNRALIIAFVAIILIVSFGFIFDRVAFILGGPLWTVRSYVVGGFDNVGAYFSSKTSLEKQNGDLTKNLDEKNVEILDLQNQIELYKGLDKYVALKEPKVDEQVVKVVTRPPQTPFDELIVNSGGLSVQDGAMAYYGVLPVGTVSMHSGSYARISLFSHPSSNFKAIVGSKKILGDAKGKSNGNVVITFPKSSDINVGDIVYLADGTIPFGKISSIDQSNSQSFVDVYVALPFSPLRADWLTLKKN